MLSTLETTILKGLIHDDAYTRKVLPYLKESYFESSVGKTYYRICQEYFSEYDSNPTKESIGVALQELGHLNEEEFQSLGEHYDELCTPSDANTKWLTDETEKWCKERAVYLALMDAISIHSGDDKDRTASSIPSILEEALAVGFDDHVGHDYLGDYKARWDFYHLKEKRIPFGLKYFDKITDGGLVPKSLNIALAGTGVGKSLWMCDIAANILMQGLNVLYISAEMSEEKIAERIDANLLDIPIAEMKSVPLQTFESKIKKIQGKTTGKFFIKEYPTASAHAGHFDALIKELKLKKKFVPDVVFIDYLNICASQRYKSGSSINSYTIVKSIAEELRGLAVKHNVPVISATQTTRGGYGNSDVELTDTSESFGLPATADLMFALISQPELEEMGQLMVKQLKNRYNDKNVHNKFVVGLDRSKMRLYDVEQGQQPELINADQLERENFKSKFEEMKSIADFSF